MAKDAQIEKQKIIFGRKSQEVQNYKLENFHLSYLRRIFAGLKIPGKGRYLDIGCGALGHLVIEAGRQGQVAAGLDISPEIIKKAEIFAEKELGENHPCQFVVGRAEKLPFSDGSFNKVSAVAVLEHLKDDEGAIAEIARILAPGGRVFISVPNSYQKIWPFFRWYYRRVDLEMGHLRHYEADELLKVFAQYGFSLVSLSYTGHWPKVFQYFLSLCFPWLPRLKWWWALEALDLKMKNKKSGLHFDLVLEKKDGQP